jgi:hypothetical protein
LSDLKEVIAQGSSSYRRREHEPVIPTQCLDDDSSAVETTRSEDDRKDGQRDLDAENERSTSNRVYVVWRRPFCYICEGWEGGHVATDRESTGMVKNRKISYRKKSRLRGCTNILSRPRDKTLATLMLERDLL